MDNTESEQRPSPTSNTAGAGIFFETDVVATCLVELLSESCFENRGSCPLEYVSVQKQDDRWKLDDVLLQYSLPSGKSCLVPTTVKSIDLFSKTIERREFVSNAWNDFLAVKRRPRAFSPNTDHLGVFANFAGSEKQSQLQTLVGKARQQNDAFLHRIIQPGLLKDSKQWLAWLKNPDAAKPDHSGGDGQIQQFIASLHIRNFDFGALTSLSLQTVREQCRLLCVGDDPVSGHQLWQDVWCFARELRIAGGDVSRADLLARLHSQVQLKCSPRFSRTVDVLRNKSNSDMRLQPRSIGSNNPVPRELVDDSLTKLFASRPIANAMVIGESGVGKSTAIVNAIDRLKGNREIFFYRLETTCDIVEQESSLFSPFTLGDVILHMGGLDRTFVVDGVEQATSEQQFRSVARFVHSVLAAPGCRVVLVCQREHFHRILRTLGDFNVDLGRWQHVEIVEFSTREALQAIRSSPSLTRLYMRPNLPSLYRRPVILDALIRITAEKQFDGLNQIGESHLVHWVWEHRILSGRGTVVGNLLMELARRQADESELETSSVSLQGFDAAMDLAINASLILRTLNKLRFSHDIYGDWARMQWLLAQGDSICTALAERSLRPKWFRAIRMLGVHFLEQNDDIEQWLGYVSNSSTMSDLFLDALFFSANPVELLDQVADGLLQDRAKLAKRLVLRALVICSVPGLLADRRNAAGEELTSFIRTYKRDPKPFHVAIGAMLSFVAKHLNIVVQHMMHEAAQLSRMWLEMTPVEWPHRNLATKIAVAIGQHVLSPRKNWYRSDDDVIIDAFKSLFYAIENDPIQTTSLLLDAAGLSPKCSNVDGDQDGRYRVDQSSDQPSKEREPWHTGPLSEPHSCFRTACLDGDAMWPIFDKAPDLARRLILAISIKVRSDDVEDFYGMGPNENGLERLFHSLGAGHYHQGPYLAFLRTNAKFGIQLVCDLANFAAFQQARSIERSGNVGVLCRIKSPLGDGSDWLGDEHCFSWNRGNFTSCGPIVPALSALEKYLGDRIETGVDVNEYVSQVLSCSRSTAPAGMLFDLCRRHPALFDGPLKRLLSNPILLLWAESIAIHSIQRRLPPSTDFDESFFEEHKAWLFAEFRSLSVLPYARRHFRENELDWSDPMVAESFQSIAENDTDVFDLLMRLAVNRAVGQPIIESNDSESNQQIVDQAVENDDDKNQLISAYQDARAIRHRLQSGEPLDASQLPDVIEFALQEVGISKSKSLDLIIRNNQFGVLLILALFHEEWLAETERAQEVIDAILDYLGRRPDKIPQELVDARAMSAYSHAVAELSICLLAHDSDRNDFRELAFRSVVGARHSVLQVISATVWHRWDDLGPWAKRLIRLLFDTAAIAWQVDENPIIFRPKETTFDVNGWYADRHRKFMAGTYPDRIPSLDELPLTPPRFLWANWRISEDEEDGNYYRAIPIDDASVEAIIEGTPLCVVGETAAIIDARLATLQVFLDLELSILPTYSLEGILLTNTVDEYPTMIGQRKLLDRIVEEIRHAESPQLSAPLWHQILDLGTQARHWVEYLLHEWMTPIICESSDSTQFRKTWTAMLNYVNNNSAWEDSTGTQRRKSYRAKLLSELLCVDKSSSSLWNDHHSALIRSMKPEIEPALREVVQEPYTAGSALIWISREIGCCFLPEAVTWCEAVGGVCEESSPDSQLVKHLVMFLDVAYRKHTKAMVGDHRECFFKLVAQAARSGNIMAIELQHRVAGL